MPYEGMEGGGRKSMKKLETCECSENNITALFNCVSQLVHHENERTVCSLSADPLFCPEFVEIANLTKCQPGAWD